MKKISRLVIAAALVAASTLVSVQAPIAQAAPQQVIAADLHCPSWLTWLCTA